jgi:hypothetical protein
MSQREGETDYKYEDYASEMATYRNPQTDAMVKKQLKITLDSGTAFDLNFIELIKSNGKVTVKAVQTDVKLWKLKQIPILLI